MLHTRFSKPLFTMFGGSERSGTGLMLMTADKRDAAEYANRKLFCEKRERIQVPRNFIDSGGGGGRG